MNQSNCECGHWEPAHLLDKNGQPFCETCAKSGNPFNALHRYRPASDSTEGQEVESPGHRPPSVLAELHSQLWNEANRLGVDLMGADWPHSSLLKAIITAHAVQLTATRTALEDCLNALDTLPPDIFGTASVSSASDEGTNWYIRDELIGRGRAALSKAKEIGKE